MLVREGKAGEAQLRIKEGSEDVTLVFFSLPPVTNLLNAMFPIYKLVNAVVEVFSASLFQEVFSPHIKGFKFLLSIHLQVGGGQKWVIMGPIIIHYRPIMANNGSIVTVIMGILLQ